MSAQDFFYITVSICAVIGIGVFVVLSIVIFRLIQSTQLLVEKMYKATSSVQLKVAESKLSILDVAQHLLGIFGRRRIAS